MQHFLSDQVSDLTKIYSKDIELVIINHQLSASQTRNLELFLNVRVIDKTELILDIFASRASSYIGKLQVELAQLRHLSTRLIRGWTHLERQKGGIGLRGPGETQLETDRRLIGKRIKRLNLRLSKSHKQKEINRYSRKELKDIWSEENKYKIWLDVEVAAAQAMEKLGQIPKGVSSVVRKKARINVKRIHQIENQVKHDVIAFLTSVTEKAGLKARYLHQGMTSSDVLDTSFNIQLAQSGKIILKDIDQILKVLKRQAKKYKLTPCMGRSHGIHAEPITFGLKMLSFYQEFIRNKKKLSKESY